MTIYQPRIGNVDSAEISVAELIEWAETYVKPKAIEAAGPDGELVPGEHCRFCKAKAVCKAIMNCEKCSNFLMTSMN